jgi:hypothetical protein
MGMKVSRSLWVALAACVAPVLAQDPSSDARLRELERQNREILERLNASEARNAELESKLGDMADERRASDLEARVETEVNALSSRMQDAVNWKQLTKSGNPIKFYGFIRLDAYYNTARFNDPYFPTTVIREVAGAPTSGGTPSVAGTVADPNDDDFVFDTRLTRFGFDINGGKIGSADVTAKLETDFANSLVSVESRETPRMRLAYVNADFGDVALRFGQDWDTISPLFPAANNETLMWNAGNLGDRRPMATFVWDGGDPQGTTFQWKLSAGLNNAVNNLDLDANLQKDGMDSGIPNFQTRIAATFDSWVDGKKATVGAWGYYSHWEFDVNIPAVGGDNGFDAWTVGVDFSVPLCDLVTMRGEAQLGEAMGDIRGSIGQFYNTTAGREIGSAGGWVEFVFHMTKEFTLTVGGTIDDVDSSDLSAASAADKNWSTYVASQYNFGGGWKAGFDVIYWETQYGNGIGNALRFNAYTMFEF